MLNAIRQRHTKRILWGLFFVIVPAFVLWGGLSSIQGRKKNILGTIDGHTITISDFNYYFKLAKLYVLLNMRDTQKLSPQDLENLAFDFLMLKNKAQKESIEVSDEEVIAQIMKDFFPQGKFNQEAYEQFLTNLSRRYNLGLSSRIFEEYMRDFIIMDKLFEKYARAEISEADIKELYTRENQKAKIAYLFVPYEKFKVEIGISPKELEEFYNENKDTFGREAKINIRYILIPEAETAELNKELETTGTLDELASGLSKEIKETGFIGINDPIQGIGWQKEINALVFALEKNTVSPPIQTDKGVIILEKKDAKAAFIPELKEIEPQVKERVILKTAKEDAKRFARELLEKIKAENITSLEVLADKKTTDFKETGYFKHDDYIEGLGLDPKVSTVIFSLKKDEIHPHIMALEQGAYIVQLKGISQFDLTDFQKKSQAYSDRIKQQKEISKKLSFLANLRKETALVIHPREE